MAIPSFQEFFRPVLQYTNESKTPVTRKELLEIGNSLFDFTEEELQETIPSGRSRIQDRVEWTILYLRWSELIENVGTGIYQITILGREILQENSVLTLKDLKEKTRFLENKNTKKTVTPINLDIESDSVKETAFDEVDLALITQDLDLNTEILNALEQWGNNTVEKGKFFENLCLELLLKMKYGIDGEVVGGSGDKGVDIILKIDKLGFEKIGVQCKCYKDTPVPSKDIAYFESGLKKKGLVKGIFITTSRFSKEALLDIERNPNIIPIDSNLLVELMKDYEVGVRSETKKIYILDIKEG